MHLDYYSLANVKLKKEKKLAKGETEEGYSDFQIIYTQVLD